MTPETSDNISSHLRTVLLFKISRSAGARSTLEKSTGSMRNSSGARCSPMISCVSRRSRLSLNRVHQTPQLAVLLLLPLPHPSRALHDLSGPGLNHNCLGGLCSLACGLSVPACTREQLA